MQRLIILDEAAMMHRLCFEVADCTLKDILQTKSIPFVGKLVVFCEKICQILPVMPKGTRQKIVHFTINSFHLWRGATLTPNMRLLSPTKKYIF
jgi:ATP-dependent DNA helicase PIF1